MNLNELNESVKRGPERFRTGRGGGSGHGKSAGRGTRGARAKSGWKYKMFREGGQMPLARRMPKRGFNNKIFATVYAFVNLRDLNQFDDGATVTLASCVAKNIVPRTLDGLKVLGTGTLEKKLTVVANRFSASAKKAIEEKGGKVELLKVVGEDTAKKWKQSRGHGKTATRRKNAKAKAAARKASPNKK
jgi:large subunit ribosomal protein L15